MNSTRYIRAILLITACSAFMGCRGLNRLIDGGESPKSEPARVISDNNTLSETPNFLIPLVPGKQQLTFHDIVPANGTVSINKDAQSTVQVFIKDFSGLWLMLGHQQAQDYAYTFDAANGQVQFHASNINLLKEYLIYQYVTQP